MEWERRWSLTPLDKGTHNAIDLKVEDAEDLEP